MFVAVKPLSADPLIPLLTNLVVTAVHSIADFFQSESKEDERFAQAYAVLKKKNKAYFVTTINTMLKDSDLDNPELEALTAFELYHCPNYIKALAETCPGYADFIKKIMDELANNPEAYKIKGFETIVTRTPWPGFKLGYDLKKTYPFYELICQIYKELLAKERKKIEEANEMAVRDEKLQEIVCADEEQVELLIENLSEDDKIALIKLLNQLKNSSYQEPHKDECENTLPNNEEE